MYKRTKITDVWLPPVPSVRICTRWACVLLAGLTSTAARAAGQSQPTVASPPAIAPAPGGRTEGSTEGPTNGATALSGPALELAPNQQPGIAVPPIPNPPMAPGARAPANQVPRVIPIEPLTGDECDAAARATGHRVPGRRDRHGPGTPTGPRDKTEDREVAGDVSNLIESVHIPESEISVAEGQTKVIQTRRDLTRIVISNPLVADVELLTDQPSSRLLNLYGKSFGTTTLTMWDQTNRPVSFLVRVSLEPRT